MKLTIGLLDVKWEVISLTTLPVEHEANGVWRLNDVPIDFETGLRRYVFLQFELEYGKLSFSVRRQPLLGLSVFYGELVEFEIFAALKRVPFNCTVRLNEERFLKVMLEASTPPPR